MEARKAVAMAAAREKAMVAARMAECQWQWWWR